MNAFLSLTDDAGNPMLVAVSQVITVRVADSGSAKEPYLTLIELCGGADRVRMVFCKQTVLQVQNQLVSKGA